MPSTPGSVFPTPQFGLSRRACLRSLVGGSLLLPGILSELAAAEAGKSEAGNSEAVADPLAPKQPHFPAKAKRVIFLFSSGGVSHMDTFDYKPELFKSEGKTTKAGGGLSNVEKPLVKPRWEFKPGGKCGTMVSDLFPHIRDCMDDIAVI